VKHAPRDKGSDTVYKPGLEQWPDRREVPVGRIDGADTAWLLTSERARDADDARRRTDHGRLGGGRGRRRNDDALLPPARGPSPPSGRRSSAAPGEVTVMGAPPAAPG